MRPTKKSFNEIKSRVVSDLSWSASRRQNVYIDNRVITRGKPILAYNRKIEIDRDSVMVFVDEAPQLNWAHPCRYLLHDASTGELYREVREQFPPYMIEPAPKTYELFHAPVRTVDVERYYPILPPLRCPIRWTRGRRHAVLFSGASNNRHTNDLEFLYRTLRDIYGFRASDIHVLNYDGGINYSGSPQPATAWPGDGTAYRMPVHGKGTKADLDKVLDGLKKTLGKDDLLLIHTNNHGAHNGTESYMCTHSGVDYTASAFAAKLATLPKINCLMVMMEQCNSGGFNAPIIANSPAALTTVSSACEELRSSIGGPQFDPFARDWISAMAGHDPYGASLASNPDVNLSGRVSAREAHNYAESIKDSYDTPVYSTSSAAASATHLGLRYWVIWPIYCRLLVELLRPYYLRRPIPEFHEMVNDRLVPQLQQIEAKLEGSDLKQEQQLREALSGLIRNTMGKP